jgi:hypothetical protein
VENYIPVTADEIINQCIRYRNSLNVDAAKNRTECINEAVSEVNNGFFHKLFCWPDATYSGTDKMLSCDKCLNRLAKIICYGLRETMYFIDKMQTKAQRIKDIAGGEKLIYMTYNDFSYLF